MLAVKQVMLSHDEEAQLLVKSQVVLRATRDVVDSIRIKCPGEVAQKGDYWRLAKLRERENAIKKNVAIRLLINSKFTAFEPATATTIADCASSSPSAFACNIESLAKIVVEGEEKATTHRSHWRLLYWFRSWDIK